MKYNRRALRRVLREQGRDIVEVARQAGLARQTVHFLARGMTVPNVTTIAALATVLNVPITVFFEGGER
jgi:transcriptional regulator with XRE-family HTH domain